MMVILLFACHNKKANSSKTTENVVNNEKMDDEMMKSEEMQVEKMDSTEIINDTLTKEEKYRNKEREIKTIPNHGSPDQMEIDSIKKAKEKMKK